jgi:hypothetical protein
MTIKNTRSRTHRNREMASFHVLSSFSHFGNCLTGSEVRGVATRLLNCSTALLMDDAGRVFSGRRLLRLKRKDAGVEVVESTWALIVAFLATQGWGPSEPAERILSVNKSVTEKDALALAATGQDVFCRALKNPMSVQVSFDMAKLAEIVDFASGGGFDIAG